MLREVQEELLGARKALEVEADIILPRVGGYSARPYNSTLGLFEGVRASEVKALWRWWARAALSRVYGGKRDLDWLDGKVSELLGGKLPDGSTRASCFGLRVEVVDERSIEEARKKYEKWHELLTKDMPRALSVLCEYLLRLCGKEGINMKVEITLTPPVSIEVEPLNQRQLDCLEKLLKARLDRISGVNVGRKKRRKRECVSISVESYSGLLKVARGLDANLSELDIAAYDDLVKLAKVPRIRLLLLPRGDENRWPYSERREGLEKRNKLYLARVAEELVPPSLKVPVRITVLEGSECSLDEAKIRFTMATLLLGLLLGGIGSDARRGFGSVAVKSVKAFNWYEEMLKECMKKLNEVLRAGQEKELKEKMRELIKYVVKEGRRAFGDDSQIVEGLPKVPMLDDGTYFRLEVVGLGGERYVDVLERLGASTLKVEWKKVVSMGVKKPGKELHTWILGLPRNVKNTGYFVKGEGGRRPSSLHLKLLELPSGRRFAIVYGFLSGDWPVEELTHKGGGREPVPVLEIPVRRPYGRKPQTTYDKDRLLRETFEAAFEFVVRILRSRAGGMRGAKRVRM